MSDTIFFYSKSIFSQFYKANHTVNDVTFICCEQGMMHDKAILFGDFESANKILRETSPAKIKALGRKVKNFNEEVWNKHKYEIVKRHNYAKFSQNANRIWLP